MNIPFYQSYATEKAPLGEHCGQMCLKMVLGVFEPQTEYGIAELEKITHKYPSPGGCWPTSALIWYVKNGYEVRFYTSSDYEAFGRDGYQYLLKTYGQEVANFNRDTTDLEYEQSLVTELFDTVHVIKKKVTTGIATGLLRKGWLVVVSINAAVLSGLDRYSPHEVVITGIDDENIWFHDPGLPAIENRKETRKLFQQAMNSFGGELYAVRKFDPNRPEKMTKKLEKIISRVEKEGKVVGLSQPFDSINDALEYLEK